MLSLDARHIVITVKNVDYSCIIHNISKCEAINLLESSALKDHEYIWKNNVLTFSQQNIAFFSFFLF